ncbi:MAG: hypothetical protein P1V97_00355 [Planctomycetota bacterium]|nr:hypothetical protein [Planctomycetota bacterium]
MDENATYANGIQVQHDQIFETVAYIETLIEDGIGEETIELTGEIDKLKYFLSRHFHWEENNEKFHNFVNQHCPHRLLDLLTVFTDHQSLLESLDEIIGALKMGGEIELIDAKVRQFLVDLRDHEKLEGELTADILCS